MAVTFDNPRGVHAPVGTYTHVARIDGGSLLAVAGQVAVNRRGTIVGKGDVRAQARQIFTNMEAILRAHGATLKDVVKVNLYVTDLRDRDVLREIIREKFGTRPPPGTLVGVTGLAHRDLLLEIEAWAAIDGSPSPRRRRGA